MIILDTHIWVWWVDDSQQLRDRKRQTIQDNAQSGLGVSAISCWEVAKLVEYGRLELACTVEEWMEQATAYSGMQLLELRRFPVKKLPFQDGDAGSIKMSYLGNAGSRFKRASTACIAAFPSEMPLSYTVRLSST